MADKVCPDRNFTERYRDSKSSYLPCDKGPPIIVVVLRYL